MDKNKGEIEWLRKQWSNHKLIIKEDMENNIDISEEDRKKFLRRINKMGHMRTWWIFGYEWWYGLKPMNMRTKEGIKYIPLFLGIWIRQ